MPVTNISSNWVSGNLVFYETGVGQSVTGDVLTIGTSSVIVGNTGQDVDFKVFMGASDTYVLFDVGNKKVTFAKVDVEIDGDLTLDLEDLQIGDDQYLQFGDATGGDVYMSWISATSILTILPTTDDTGAIHIGNGTKDIDFKVFLGAADTSALFDVGNTSLTLAKVNLTFSTALDIITAANTAVALEFYDATTKYVAIDTRNTVAADMLTVTGIPATIAGASGTTRRMLNIVPGTTTLTGSTGVTNMSGIDAYFTAPTLTDSSAITVAKASTVCIAGVPAAGGSVTITSALALEVLGATNFGVDAAGVDVTLFGAVTGYKVWFDANGDTNGAVFFGADTKGIMTTWYGDTTAYLVKFDPSGDTNGAWYFGADTKGIQVNFYGDVTGCGAFWDPTTDTNGTWTFGGSGGSKGNDVVAYGATNGNYMKWDQSANSLLLTGTSTVLSVAGTTESSSTTTGALIVTGGIGFGGDMYVGDDIFMVADGVINFGAGDVTITGGTNTLAFAGASEGVTFDGKTVVTVASLNATTGRTAKFDGTVLTPNFGDGYGAIECNLNIGTGAVAGFVAGASSWINLAATTTFSAGGALSPLDVGVWCPTGATLTNSKMIMGLKMSCVIDDGANPGELYLFNTNIFSNATTALFDINTIVDFAATASAASSGAYKVPFLKERSTGTVWYMNIYTS